MPDEHSIARWRSAKRRAAPRRMRLAALLAAMASASLPIAAVPARALTPIELLGKNVFFDTNLSRPRGKQACASCHDAARGWTFPNAAVNRTTVAAPGAVPGAIGSIKTPTNAYAFFSPPFHPLSSPPPFGPFFEGGNFWDGRAEGCGKTGGPCPVGNGTFSPTITPADLPPLRRAIFKRYLGTTADQALNPLPNLVEQNIPIDDVCREVQFARYRALYTLAFLVPINCSAIALVPGADRPALTSFKRIAVAVAAWQASSEVNSFSSRRDIALRLERDGQFPLQGFTPQENLGHDLFYGVTSALNPGGRNAQCAGCHNGVPAGDQPDPANGLARRELYSDSRFHNIGIPYNREIPNVGFGQKVGVGGHVPGFSGPDLSGMFKTPTLRNVAKGLRGGFVKSYGHNGYFKSLMGIVHFYNTRDVLPRCATLNATEQEALAAGCWPASEHPNPAAFVIGNLGLAAKEEAAIVAYMATLSDLVTPRRP